MTKFHSKSKPVAKSGPVIKPEPESEIPDKPDHTKTRPHVTLTHFNWNYSNSILLMTKSGVQKFRHYYTCGINAEYVAAFWSDEDRVEFSKLGGPTFFFVDCESLSEYLRFKNKQIGE